MADKKRYTQVGDSSRSTLPVKVVNAKTGKRQHLKEIDLNLSNKTFDTSTKLMNKSKYGKAAIKSGSDYPAKSEFGKKVNSADRAAIKVWEKKHDKKKNK